MSGATATASVTHFSKGFVGAACAVGVACTPANACHTGRRTCNGTPACADTGTPVEDGTTCRDGPHLLVRDLRWAYVHGRPGLRADRDRGRVQDLRDGMRD